MNSESKRPIQVEDLLQLKRAERPPAEFWPEFDRQLRAKQLAALVAKRPWWQRVPRLFAGFSRYHLSLGAAAVMAVAFITIRDQSPARIDQPIQGSTVGAASQPAVSVVAKATAVPATTIAAEIQSHAELERPSQRPAAVLTVSIEPQALASDATTPGELSGLVPLLGASPVQSAPEAGGLAAHYVAAPVANVGGAEPALATNLLATNVFESRAMTRAAVEPLQQMTPPSERGRGRLMNAMVAMASQETPSRTGERTASRLDEERLSDQVRRLGARGDRVMWKF